jgi:hypothetical protein
MSSQVNSYLILIIASCAFGMPIAGSAAWRIEQVANPPPPLRRMLLQYARNATNLVFPISFCNESHCLNRPDFPISARLSDSMMAPGER